MYDVNSIDEAVEVLGGDSEVAAMFFISQPAVGNWKARGIISAGAHLRLYLRLRRLSLTVNPVVFGLTESEAHDLEYDLKRQIKRRIERRANA